MELSTQDNLILDLYTKLSLKQDNLTPNLMCTLNYYKISKWQICNIFLSFFQKNKAKHFIEDSSLESFSSIFLKKKKQLKNTLKCHLKYLTEICFSTKTQMSSPFLVSK